MPLELIIRRQIRKLEQELEQYLIKQTGKEDWSINITYNYITEYNQVKERFLTRVCSYDKNDKQKAFEFTFSSNETIFFNKICDTILKVVNDPEKHESICEQAEIYIKTIYIQGIL